MNVRQGLGLVFFLSGCFTDLSGTKVQRDLSGGGGGNDLSVGGDDGGGGGDADLTGVTLDLKSNQDGGGGDLAPSATCALPYLAVLINTSSGAATHGRVERIPLDGRPRCKALTLGNSLPVNGTALGFLPPETIAVGGTNIVYQIKGDDKAAAGFFQGDTSYAYGVPVDDLFPVLDATGKQLLGITYDNNQFTSTGTEVAYLAIIDGDQHVDHWEVATSAVIKIGSNVRSMTTSPLDRHKIMATKVYDPAFAAAEFTPPWTDTPVEVTTPHYQGALGSPGQTHTIKTLRVQPASDVIARTAWTFRANGGGYSVYYLNDDQMGGKDLVGPLTCNLAVCSTEMTDPILDAVPDPGNLDAVIAICIDKDASSSPDKAHVVRMKADGSCEMILDGDDLFSQEYPGKLANAILEP